ncbi:septation protein SepH [Nocardioides terrae]|nr:septation protein SepH [Nocardioides terrae]
MTPVPDQGPAPEPSGRPRQLTPVTVTRDGARLILVDQDGNEFAIAVDDSLRTALPTPPAAADQPRRSEKTPMTAPTLRPRDIQTRIRSGESPESVADAAGTTVEKIMPFAAPVIAEREHIAERALKASVRRRPAETTAASASARTLGSAVAAHLSNLDVLADTVEWDAWRRTDGRWSLVAIYETPSRSGTAELTFDPPGNFVSLDNDDARWLVGDLVVPEPEPVRDDLAQVRERRLAPVPKATAVIDDVLPIDEPLEAFLPEAPTTTGAETPVAEPVIEPTVEAEPERRPERRPEQEAPAAEASPEPAPAPEQPARRTPAKKRGRASVPSWDEIMFGGGGS